MLNSVGTCISFHLSQLNLPNGAKKFYWRWQQNSRRTILFGGILQRCSLRAIFLSALNIFLSISAFLVKTLILVALHKETSLHPPSKLLYRNLAITDLCVGIIADPLAVTHLTSVVTKRWDICLLRLFGRKPFRLYLIMFSVFINIDSNKRGQTSCLVARAQIQTNCNLEKNVFCIWVLDFVYTGFV